MIVKLDVFNTTTIAMCVFFLGHVILRRSPVLRKYSIPEPLLGGVACAVVIALIHALLDVTITFDLERRDILLVYFFAALGLRSNVSQVIANGRPLFILVALAAAFIVVQNLAGIVLAQAFGHDVHFGIVAGSMSFTGRSGTTVAWAPFFRDQLGLDHVSRLGLAASTAGLIAACCIGGPLAKFLISRYHLQAPGPASSIDVGTAVENEDTPRLDYHGFILALLRIHIAILIGQILSSALDKAGIIMPLYVSCLIGGILLGNVWSRLSPKLNWPGSDECLSLFSYVCLGLFYSMTLMSLQLWTAGEFLAFVIVATIVQVALAVAYAWFVVFRLMGRDYEAAVFAAGFTGISLGTTATTMAIISAVAKQYGSAHRAFVVIPLTCGVFIDIANSLVIKLFTWL
mgnify:CR=1 FL=1